MTVDNMLVRLQKHIADLGICSRRKAEVLIGEGKVSVNGKRVNTMGVKVDPTKDRVEVLGHEQRASASDELVYLALHKPIDFISSASSAQGKSVLDLITIEQCVQRAQRQRKIPRVYPVGRLDKDSEGLILLTNDGELTNKLTHPRFEHEKEYEVTLGEPLSKDAKHVLTRGMRIGDDRVRGIRIKKELRKGKRFVVTVVLKEGKNRQIRKMFGQLGYNILSLKRTRIGHLTIGTLPVGKWRFVKKDAIV